MNLPYNYFSPNTNGNTEGMFHLNNFYEDSSYLPSPFSFHETETSSLTTNTDPHCEEFLVDQNYSKAEELLYKANEARKKALEILHDCSNKNHSNSLNALGEIYCYGSGLIKHSRSINQAEIVNQIGINLKYTGEIYFVSASSSFKAASEQGDPQALLNYALSLFYGQGIKKNYVQSALLFKKLADEYHFPEAQYKMGQYLFTGYGMPKNLTESFRYFLLAAKNNHDDAYDQVGIMTYYGNGTPLDKAKATQIFKAKADVGNNFARYNYSLCIDHPVESLKYLQLSAEGGYSPAIHSLGLCYYYGNKGLKKNKKLAAFWFRKGWEKSNLKCLRMLEILEKEAKGEPIEDLLNTSFSLSITNTDAPKYATITHLHNSQFTINNHTNFPTQGAN